jgi:hypothetical protein
VKTIGVAHPVMTALARRVPLTLLMDLADPGGPDSRMIGASEVADLSWLRDLAYPPPGPAPRSTTESSPVVLQLGS